METVVALLMFRSSFIKGLWFSRWARQETSIIAMSRLLGRKINVLAFAWSAHLISDQIRPGRGWASTSLSFLTTIMEQGA